MKTMLWATLTANGNYAQSGPDNPPKPETLDDFVAHARAAGNFIVGRRTFENMQASGGGFGDALAGIDIVVVSGTVTEMPGVRLAASPREALAYLKEKGHALALIAGGADMHNAFLGEGLVDELLFNMAPVLEGKGLHLVTDQAQYRVQNVQLLHCKPLGGGVVQLHYAVGKA
ncbi:dihydrofolate reductase family protein [Paenibacillus rigui]|uniref:Dihydrofolate reductase n=1 Tax=Paenibacillus rigui TaxID=554312 RepID=A0A229UVG3_9BACL|nr:dihydrofolate reductase family protein [Paenibacillus rigui]OXM87125.1 dihydrofolate reductase [Paenibacillus rigui]